MTPDYQDSAVTLYHGDTLAVLIEMTDESVQTCITSPPYWGLRDYGVEGQLGLEPTPEEYVAKELGRKSVGIDLKAEYIDLATKRLRQEVLAL
ncbi:MAG: hypothetical protein HW395_46 [candidate division NC10 bacterium]|nr:hypothetical protein [candidate division NC10 bacterium]